MAVVLVDKQTYREACEIVAGLPPARFMCVDDQIFFSDTTLFHFDKGPDGIQLEFFLPGVVMRRQVIVECGFVLADVQVGKDQVVKWINPHAEGWEDDKEVSGDNAVALDQG